MKIYCGLSTELKIDIFVTGFERKLKKKKTNYCLIMNKKQIILETETSKSMLLVCFVYALCIQKCQKSMLCIQGAGWYNGSARV